MVTRQKIRTEAGRRNLMRPPRPRRQTCAEKEDHVVALVAELSALGDDASVDLAERLLHCHMERRARTKAWTEIGAATMGWPYRCKSAACWSCRRAIVRLWCARAERFFAGAASEGCSHITIMLARLGDLSLLSTVVSKARRDLRNLRAGMTRTCDAWNRMSLMGHVELDALAETDVPLLGSDRQSVLSLLPTLGRCTDAMFWLPHAHLCVHHPGVPREYVEDAFTAQWRGAKRTYVQSFNGGQSAEESAADCVAYGLKSRHWTTFNEGIRAPWPLAWSARVWSWLHERRKGLQPLSVKLGRRSAPVEPLLASRFEVRRMLEPMPMVR